MGRKSKLNDDRLHAIIAGLKLGLSETEASEATGITYRTFLNWKSRARAAADVLPEDWASLKFEELLACADELEIDMAGVRHSGRRGRLTREDVLRVIRERAELYVDFLRQVEAAGPESKLAILKNIDDLINGRVEVKRTRTTQIVRNAAGDRIVVMTEILKLPPDRMAAFKMLEARWPEEFGRRAGGRGGVNESDSSKAAEDVHEALHRMLSTVPPPIDLPALPAHREDEAEEQP